MIQQSYDDRLAHIKSAMERDSLMNEEKHEHGRVSVQDVSDCPGLKDLVEIALETCEDCMDDLTHEMLMSELREYAS